MIISLNSFFRDFLFLIIAVYFAQGAFYTTGSVIAKICLLLILVISAVYLIKSLLIKSKKELFYYALIALLFLNIFGFFINGELDGIYFSQIRNILTAFLPFFPFYYFSYKGDLSKNNILRFFIILIPIAVISFYTSRNDIIAQQLTDSENIVTNTAYFFVALIPYVFLLGKRKTLSFLSLILLLFFIIQSAKRGALIIGGMGGLIYIYYQLATIQKSKRIQGFVLALIGVTLLLISSYYFYISNEFLIKRLEEVDEGASGRGIIYSILLNSWYESNSIIDYLFGFGFVSSIKHSGGLLAHNDWIELLINFGLLGVFIYLFLFYAAVRFIANPKVKKEHRIIMIAIISIWFLQTLFSMFYTSSLTSLTSVVLGYLIGSYHCKKITTIHVKPETQSKIFQE